MADQNPPDADRTKRVAANIRKKLAGMSRAQYVPHNRLDVSPTADQSMASGEGTDSEGNAKPLPLDLPPKKDDGEVAADKMPSPRHGKIVRSLTDAYKKAK